jgi:hypothetical protein
MFLSALGWAKPYLAIVIVNTIQYNTIHFSHPYLVLDLASRPFAADMLYYGGSGGDAETPVEDSQQVA